MNSTSPTGSAKVNPHYILVCGIFAVSTGAIFVRLADAPALVIAAYRVGIAALILIPIVGWKARAELRTLTPRDFWLAALSGFFLALHFATWISSLKHTSIANSVVLVNTAPLWVGIIAPIILKEPSKRYTFVSIILSVVGCIIIGSGDITLGGKALWGDFLALIGGFCTACYLMIGKKLRLKYSLLVYICLCYGCAAIVLWVTVLAMSLPLSGFGSQTVAAFLGMALISQLIGHSSYNWALRYCSTALVALSLLGEPVGSTILALLIFQEGLTLSKIIGGVLILSAIYLAAKSE